jgi:hypothetical protein
VGADGEARRDGKRHLRDPAGLAAAAGGASVAYTDRAVLEAASVAGSEFASAAVSAALGSSDSREVPLIRALSRRLAFELINLPHPLPVRNTRRPEAPPYPRGSSPSQARWFFPAPVDRAPGSPAGLLPRPSRLPVLRPAKPGAGNDDHPCFAARALEWTLFRGSHAQRARRRGRRGPTDHSEPVVGSNRRTGQPWRQRVECDSTGD